jgi:hypothetical protein
MNAYLGSGTQMDLQTGPGGGTNADLYIADNLCVPASNCAATIRATANPIPSEFAVTPLLPTDLAKELLPHVGAPNRTSEDQQRVDEVAAAFP